MPRVGGCVGGARPARSLGAAARVGMVLTLCLFVLAAADGRAAPRGEAEAAFREGNRLYEAQEYAAALASYRDVLKKGYVSPELFLNLGNAAYRIGEPGWAAYYYEQALRRAPGDPDIRSNLAQARRESLGDEATVRGSAFLERAVGLQNRISLKSAVVGGVILVWIAAGLLVVTWLWASGRLKRALRTAALAAAVAAVVMLGFKAAQESLASEALVIRPCTAHAEPSADATVEFRLPAASPVALGRLAPGWREVIVSSSLRGWVRDEDVASFADPR